MSCHPEELNYPTKCTEASWRVGVQLSSMASTVNWRTVLWKDRFCSKTGQVKLQVLEAALLNPQVVSVPPGLRSSSCLAAGKLRSQARRKRGHMLAKD